MGGATFLLGVQVTDDYVMGIQCAHCIRFAESDRIAREQALAAEAQERKAQRATYQARWNSMIDTVPTASQADLASFLQGTAIDVADYVCKFTRLSLRSLDADKVFAWMDLPTVPISQGSLGAGYEPGQIVYSGALDKLCNLVRMGRLPSVTPEGQVVRRIRPVSSSVVADVLYQVGPTPVRHVIFSRPGTVTTNTPTTTSTKRAASLEELKDVRRSLRKERVNGWIFNPSNTGQSVGQVSRRGIGLVVTTDGRCARLDGHSCRYRREKGYGASGDPLRESMEVGEVKMLGDPWVVLGPGDLKDRDLKLIRSHMLPEC